jgi:CheY-like chemotaxis protein
MIPTDLSHRAVYGDALAASHDGQTNAHKDAAYVLVVDDDPAVREFVERCLALEGYNVKQAAGASSALETMAQGPASLVLCDVRMPGRDGLWLAERLQAEWPSTPIVMVTAMDDLQTIQQSREIGAIDYLTKPINRQQLRQVVRRAIPAPVPPPDPSSEGSPAEPRLTDPAIEAEYTLETPVRCPACGERTSTLKAVRLIRARVNFTSTLPRRGRVLACPHCLAIVPAELTNF